MARLAPLVILAACADPPTDARIELDTESIALGAVECGSTKTAIVEVANPGGGVLELSAESSLAGVTIAPATTAVSPGRTVELVITATSSDGLGVKSGLIALTSNAGDRVIPIELESTGIEVAFDRTLLDFGELLPGDSIERAVGITVTGTGARVSITVDSDGFTSNGSVEIAAGQTQELPVRFTAGATPALHSAIATVALSGPLCRAAPELALAGAASTDAVQVDRTVIDFDTVRCGEFDEPGSFSLINRSGSDTDFVASVTDPLAWFIVEPRGGPANGQLPAGATVRVPIGHFAIRKVPPGLYTGVVELRLNEATTIKHVPIQATIQRPVVRLDTTAIDFGTTARNSTVTRTFRVFNEGNIATDTLNMFSNDPELSFSPQQFSVPANNSRLVTVTFKPTATTAATFAGVVTFHPTNCEDTEFVEFAARVN